MPERRGHSPLLAPRLDTHVVGARAIILLDEVDSTSNYAFRLGGDGTVVAANHQTAGRGRHGREWHSAPGLGLWFSVVFEGTLRGLTFAAALAVRDSLAGKCAPTVKWPNDVFVNGRKVCGILVEHRHSLTVLGIGINVHHREQDFPEHLADTAGSLESTTGLNFSRTEVLREVLTHLDRNIAVLRNGGYEAIRCAWAEACNVRGRRVVCGDTPGIIVDVDEQGALVVETPQGYRRVLAGEISLPRGA